MKKNLLILSLLVLGSCSQTDLRPTDTTKGLAKTKVSSLASEPYLKDIFDKVGFKQTKNGRKNSLGANVNTDSIVMALQADGFSYSYTFKVEGDGKNGSFTNLVFKRVVGGVKAFYLRYEPDKPYQFDLKTFTGKVTSFDLDMKEISSQNFVKGSLVPNKAGRTQGCQPTVSVTSECTNDDGKSTATGADLPCLYGTKTTVITLDYSNCLLTDSAGPGGGGNLPSGYTQWSNGTFVKFEYFNNGGPGGGQIGGGGSGSCGGDGVSTLSSGSDPNSCNDVIGIYPPTDEELLRFLTDALIANLTSETLLDVQQNDRLKEVFKEVYKKCPNKFFINALNQNGFKFEFKIDNSLTTPGGFYPDKNSIKFRSTNDINYNTLQEELFHAYQHLTSNIQPLLTAPYLGRSNIEFESKVYADVVCVLNNTMGCAYLGGDSDEYSSWILEITNDWNEYPSWDKMKLKYFKFLEDFVKFNPSYDYPIDYNLIPQASFKAFDGC
jgi:hypothetical protein